MNFSDVLSSPITWIIITALSEIIGTSKLKQNSVLALIFDTLKKMKPKTLNDHNPK